MKRRMKKAIDEQRGGRQAEKDESEKLTVGLGVRM